MWALPRVDRGPPFGVVPKTRKKFAGDPFAGGENGRVAACQILELELSPSQLVIIINVSMLERTTRTTSGRGPQTCGGSR